MLSDAISAAQALFSSVLGPAFSGCCADGADEQRFETRDGPLASAAYEDTMISTPIFPTILAKEAPSTPSQEGGQPKGLSPHSESEARQPRSPAGHAPPVAQHIAPEAEVGHEAPAEVVEAALPEAEVAEDLAGPADKAADPEDVEEAEEVVEAEGPEAEAEAPASPSGVQWKQGGVIASLITGTAVGDGGLPVDELVERDEVELEGGGRYWGQWLGSERHGKGVLLGPGGDRYSGLFHHNVAHGRGTLVEADGSRYEGQWRNDMKHGHGIYIHVDGTTYEGQWAEDSKCGTGTESWADGASYQGEFRNGLKHGVGVYRGRGAEYEGQFSEDKMHGQGCYTFATGRKYCGCWAEGHMSGHGRMELPTGAVYEGEYLNGVKHGHGTFTAPDGKSYCGDWARGKQHGRGIANDGEDNLEEQIWEHGEFVSGEPLTPGATAAHLAGGEGSDLEEDGP